MADAARSLCLSALALLGSCSVGNLRYQEVLSELDGVMQVVRQEDKPGKPLKLDYRDEAPVASWSLQFTPFLPLQPVLRALVGDAAVTKLPNPSEHARELAEALGDKAAGSLLKSADAATRLLQIASLDVSNLNRIVAIDALAKMCRAQDLPLLPGLSDAASYPGVDPGLDDAIETLRRARPASRDDGRQLDDIARAQYAAALQTLTSRPLTTPERRVALVSDLANALRGESDPALRPVTAAALRQALQYGVDWLLLELLADRDAELQPTRLCVFDLLHAAGGGDAVPVLLAWMRAPSAAVRDGREPYEGGSMRLRLIHACGQLDRERGARAVLLPGREAWEAVAPLQFLCEQILPAVDPGADTDPFGNPMRLPAQEALCWSLGRLIDYDTAWVSAWYQEFRRAQ